LEIDIAEPWDFESDAGQNLTRGRLVDIGKARGSDETFWVVRATHDVNARGMSGRTLVLRARHAEAALSQAWAREGIPVSVGLIAKEDEGREDSVATAVLALVGSVRRCKTGRDRAAFAGLPTDPPNS
jgi:hypothetical protein